MKDPREELMREAAEIFLQLREMPDDAELLAKRDAFCGRGKAESDVYLELVKSWKASGVMQAPRTLMSLIAFCFAMVGAVYVTYDPIRIAVLADVSTGVDQVRNTLRSGDIVVLDADSALIDQTQSGTRHVALLQGAAFFQVDNDGRQFSVSAGGATVTVIGTAFETSLADDTVVVGVTEGRVDVSVGAKTWKLESGEQFEWSSHTGPNVKIRDTATIASWRADRLVVDGMTLGQAAAIIERRLPGPVFFSSATLRGTRVTGSLDLRQPLAALRILAQTGGGTVYNAGRLGRIIARQ